jgi:hypothetical protein
VIHDAMHSQRLLRTLSISLQVSASALENEWTAALPAVISQIKAKESSLLISSRSISRPHP